MTALARQSDSGEAPPLDMLMALFEAHGWPCRMQSSDEVTGEVQGSWTKYQLRAVSRPEDNSLQLLCLPDIRVPPVKRTVASELLAKINEQVWLGHFDMWANGGMLVFRHSLLLSDDGTLSIAQAQSLVESAVEECDRFYPAFQFALWSDKSPEDALSSALIDAMGEA